MAESNYSDKLTNSSKTALAWHTHTHNKCIVITQQVSPRSVAMVNKCPGRSKWKGRTEVILTLTLWQRRRSARYEDRLGAYLKLAARLYERIKIRYKLLCKNKITENFSNISLGFQDSNELSGRFFSKAHERVRAGLWNCSTLYAWVWQKFSFVEVILLDSEGGQTIDHTDSHTAETTFCTLRLITETHSYWF